METSKLNNGGMKMSGPVIGIDLEEWTKAGDSDEALSAYNIFVSGLSVEA